MKKLLGGLLACLMMISMSGCSSSEPETKDDVKTIGILIYANHPALDSASKGLQTYLRDKGYDETKVKFVEKNAQNDDGTAEMIASQFANKKVDLIYAIGTNAGLSAAKATLDTNIPVIFNAVTDAVDAGIVKTNEKPGGNVTGVSDAAPLEKQLELIRTMLPKAKTIGMIYNTGEPNGKLQVKQVEALADQYGFTVKAQGVSLSTDVATAAEQLAGKVDCFYNITDNMIVNATASITDKANAYKIPVFAAEDGQMEAGLLASDSISYDKLGKQAGAIAEDILFNGKNPGDINVETASDTTLMINRKVADELGIQIPAELEKRATFYGE